MFRRADAKAGERWTWGINYDFFTDNRYGVNAFDVNLHQIRFMLGRTLGSQDEIGLWGAAGISQDQLALGPGPALHAEAQDQASIYWRHYYEFGGESILYVGFADANFTFINPISGNMNANSDFSEVVLGYRGIAPLSRNLGLVSGVHYVLPSAGSTFGSAIDEESWNVSCGLMWVRGHNLSILPVADNGWFGKRLIQSF